MQEENLASMMQTTTANMQGELSTELQSVTYHYIIVTYRYIPLHTVTCELSTELQSVTYRYITSPLHHR